MPHQSISILELQCTNDSLKNRDSDSQRFTHHIQRNQSHQFARWDYVETRGIRGGGQGVAINFTIKFTIFKKWQRCFQFLAEKAQKDER